MTEDFLVHTRTSFDKIAEHYDVRDNANEILQWMRGIVHEIYQQNFKPGDKILELNCGTGEDAIFLADNGIKVFATDISPKMVKILQNKAKLAHFEDNLKAEAFSFDEINKVNENNFNGAVSNFGGLNCINDFRKLENGLSEKIKPGGKFIAVVMNKFCPWEVLYYMLKFDFKNAFRRFKKNGIDAELNGEKVRTFYFYPAEFAKHFGNSFKLEKVYTLGLYTPPPYLIGIYRKLKPAVKLFMAIDKIVKGIFPFNRFGDHFIIVMKKIA